MDRQALEIRETDDEPLLFTLLRPWFHNRAWEVFDAEDRPVGSLRGNLVRDRFGHHLAEVEQLAGGNGFRFGSRDGNELAVLRPDDAGSQLIFAEDLLGDPFARMLLLAGGLALTHSPARAG
jgi:hypothetical protein